MSEIAREMEEIKEWLKDRPSPTMDPFWDEALVKRARLRELKAFRRALERPPSSMMESQTMSEE